MIRVKNPTRSGAYLFAMAYKDMLVYLDSEGAAPARLDAALEMAHAHRALLSGYYLIAAARIPSYALVGEPLPLQEFEAEERERRRAGAETMRETFLERAKRAHVQAEWHQVDCASSRQPQRHIGHSDLIIIGQQDRPEVGQSAAEVVLRAGRPVLVVPLLGVSGAIGARVLIAWNASREAVRAINDALPLLERADEVHLVVVSAEEQAPDFPTAEIGFHLERHGVSARKRVIPPSGDDGGDTLLSYAADEGMDLLVMGAYGRSRLSELVLGGVTRRVLRDTVVPVLMSH